MGGFIYLNQAYMLDPQTIIQQMSYFIYYNQLL